MLFTGILIISVLTLLANGQPTTPEAVYVTLTSIIDPPSQASPQITTPPVVCPSPLPREILDYSSALTKDINYLIARNQFISAMPESELEKAMEDPAAYMSSAMGREAGNEPSWVRAVPTSALEVFQSVAVMESSICASVARGLAPTNGPQMKIMGAALAVGAAGLAMM